MFMRSLQAALLTGQKTTAGSFGADLAYDPIEICYNRKRCIFF